MEEPIGSPFRNKRDRDQDEERWAGRYIIDFAYSLGRLSALGDEGALEMLRQVGFAESKKVRRALADQFRAGMRHERAHGAPLTGD